MSILTPFQLLELNVISAQDLIPISRSMRTYAVAWIHPDRKLSTRVDTHGHTNPTWNDKFVFRINDDFLDSEISAIMIEIYALHWFKDVHVGTVRVLVGNLIEIPTKPHRRYSPQIGMRFVALQVRRPSGRPQGILNIGVALLHSSMRSMPLYSQLNSSAVGYKELMGDVEEGPPPPSSQTQKLTFSKSELRRSKSDCSSMLGSTLRTKQFKEKGKNGSSDSKSSSSVVSGESEVNNKKYKKGRSKASSLINGSDVLNGRGRRGKASSVVSVSDVSWKGKFGKPSSIRNFDDSDVGLKFGGKKEKNDHLAASTPLIKPSPRYMQSYEATPARPSPFKMGIYETPRKSNMFPVAYLTESELGPSASEVAAVRAREIKEDPFENESSIIVGEWNEDESIEGLHSKLERWRTELPPVYDHSGQYTSFTTSSEIIERRPTRPHSDGGNGLFSCFSNICGVECSIVCGGGGSDGEGSVKERRKAGNKSGGRIRKSPSAGDMSYL